MTLIHLDTVSGNYALLLWVTGAKQCVGAAVGAPGERKTLCRPDSCPGPSGKAK